MCLRYSSSVVAPTARSSPRASIGLSRLPRRDGAFGRAGPDDRVQLVDEEHDLALAELDLVEHRLEPLLELAAVFRSGEERADVERPDALALQPLGDVAGDDPLREPFDDRRLPDARLADQHGIVLRPARQHLDRPADLLVAADHRVELSLLGEGGQIAAVLLECLVRALGILLGDALATSHLLERSEELFARHDVEREQEMLDGHELVAERAHLVGALSRHAGERRRTRAAERTPETDGSCARRASASARR